MRASYDEEARIASVKATCTKKREERWNLIKFDQDIKGHVSVPVQCTNEICSLRNETLPTTHVISAEDAGDDNVQVRNRRCHVYLVDSEGQVDMENSIYCPQDDPKPNKGGVNGKIDNFFRTDKINQPPNGDGKGIGRTECSEALNKEGGGYVKNDRFFIKRESPPAFKAVVERCTECKWFLKTVNKSDEPKSITTQDLRNRENAGQIG